MSKSKKKKTLNIIDTCSLTSPYIETFLADFFSTGEKLYVPMTVAEEIVKLMDKYKLKRDDIEKQHYEDACRGWKVFLYYKKRKDIIHFRDHDEQKNKSIFNDMFMFSLLNIKRQKNDILFITQDNNLAKAIVCMNQLAFMDRKHTITVRQIAEKGNKKGTLEKFWFDQDPSCWKLLDPKIGKPNESDEYMLKTYGQTVREILNDLHNKNNQNSRQSQTQAYGYRNKKDANGEWIPPLIISAKGYHLADGSLLKPQKKIGSGGEGNIYQIEDSDLLMKLYKDGRGYDDHNTYQKLLEMTNINLSYDGICFPIDIVYDANNKFSGYTMKAARGRSLKTTVLGKEKALRYFGENFKKTDQIDICMQILEKIDYIHHHNMLVGDLSANNIMVDQDKTVYFIDTDSFQIDNKFKCSVGTREYVPPELIGKDFSKIFRTEDNENFSIALLLFHILVGGAYPYSQVGDENQTYDDLTMAERTIQGVFPYYFPNRKEEKNATPLEGGYRYFWSHLTRNIKNMFGETFHSEGERFRENRYTVSDWIKILKRYKHYLTTDDEKYAKNRDPADLEAFPLQYKVVDEDLLDEGKYITCNVCGKKTLNIYAVGARCLNCTNKVMHRRGDPMAPTCRICHKWIPYTYRQYDHNEPIPTLCDECKADIKSGLIDKNGNPL